MNTQQKIKAAVRQLQSAHPELSFDDAWGMTQHSHPEWFEQSPIGLATSPAKTVSELVADFLSAKPKPREAAVAVVHASHEPVTIRGNEWRWDRSN
jgi:hypothetical protein